MHSSVLEVNLAAIRENLRLLARRVAPAELMAVVKADAYGHGAVPVARAALQAGATRLAVANPAEGTALRQAEIDAPIQVLGGFFPQQIEEMFASRLEFTLCHAEALEWLSTYCREHGVRAPVHVKIDTGMRRVGFDWQQAAPVLTRLQEPGLFDLVGLMTHLATADEQDNRFAREQLARFRHTIDLAHKLGLSFRYYHAANSAAILELPDAYFNLVRPGISLYGYYPSAEMAHSLPLRPAVTWRSSLLQVKRVAAGEGASYGLSWRTPVETVLGTVPVGYADGYRRALSNRAHAVINDRRVPVVGHVCMDMILLDLGPNATEQPGDPVVLLGGTGKASVPVQEFCELLQTIPYEITCMIAGRVQRRFVESPADPPASAPG